MVSNESASSSSTSQIDFGVSFSEHPKSKKLNAIKTINIFFIQLPPFFTYIYYK